VKIELLDLEWENKWEIERTDLNCPVSRDIHCFYLSNDY
jgi:hypothetical protein